MKSYRVDYMLNGTTSAWSIVEAISERHAARKLSMLLETHYPQYSHTVTSCKITEGSRIKSGAQFIYEGIDYMWNTQLDDNMWRVTNLQDNNEYDARIDNANNIVDIQPAPLEPGVNFGMASVLNALITDEYEAIEGYNSAIVTAQQEGLDDVVKILTDIQAEEQLHVGQLQRAMELFDPNATKVAEGVKEASEQLDSDDVSADDIDGFISAYENHMKEGTQSYAQ